MIINESYGFKDHTVMNLARVLMKIEIPIEDIVNLLVSQDIEDIKKDSRFVSTDFMYDSLNWDYPFDKADSNGTCVVVMLNSDNQWVLEFRPISSIIGVVKYAYDIDKFK